MADSNLSILIMRDDAKVKRLRTRPVYIRMFIYFILLLILAAAGGGFAGYYFFEQTEVLRVEKSELETQLNETAKKLNRLENIEQLLQSSDPNGLKAILGSIGYEAPKDPAALGKKTQVQTAAQPAPPAQPAPSQASSDKDAPRESERPAIDLGEILAKVDLQQIGVENVKLKLDKGAAQVRFDLNNLLPQQALAGSAQLFVVTRAGQLMSLEASKEELTFQIQRFKQVTANAQVAPTLERKDLFGLKLVINNSAGKTIFSETYPLAQL